MDYLQQLAVIRDNMHRELVQESTVRTFMSLVIYWEKMLRVTNVVLITVT